MRRLLLVAAVAVAPMVGIGAALTFGGVGSGDGSTRDAATLPESVDGVPAAVDASRAALLEAAENGDYEAIRLLVPDDGFEYTFGGPVEGGPIAYWQELERTTSERPLEALAAILRMPYVLSHGYYVWPWAYTVASRADLSAYERELLAPLGTPGELVLDGTGYFGWRAGFEPDGTWAFFVAGD